MRGGSRSNRSSSRNLARRRAASSDVGVSSPHATSSWPQREGVSSADSGNDGWDGTTTSFNIIRSSIDSKEPAMGATATITMGPFWGGTTCTSEDRGEYAVRGATVAKEVAIWRANSSSMGQSTWSIGSIHMGDIEHLSGSIPARSSTGEPPASTLVAASPSPLEVVALVCFPRRRRCPRLPPTPAMVTCTGPPTQAELRDTRGGASACLGRLQSLAMWWRPRQRRQRRGNRQVATWWVEDR